MDKRRTLATPVLVGVTEQHDELVHGKGLQIGDGEDLGETILEGFGLELGTMPNDSVDDFLNIFLDVILGDGGVLAIRLQR